MKKFRIGLDLDGVIVDHTRNKMRVAKSVGFVVRKNQTHEAILKQIMPEEKYRELQRQIYGAMSMSAMPVTEAKLTIRRLAQRGHTLFIVSRRGKDAPVALEWLKKHGVLDSIPHTHIAFVDADVGKAPVVKKLGIEIFLDDKPSVLDCLASFTEPVFFNNWKLDINPARYAEIYSWRDFLNLVDHKSA